MSTLTFEAFKESVKKMYYSEAGRKINERISDNLNALITPHVDEGRVITELRELIKMKNSIMLAKVGDVIE